MNRLRISLLTLLAMFFLSTPVLADYDEDSDSESPSCSGAHCQDTHNVDNSTSNAGGAGGSVSGTISPTFTGTQTGTVSPTIRTSITGTQTGTVSPTISPTFSPTLSPTFSPTVSPTSGVQIGNFGNDEDSDSDGDYGDVLSPTATSDQDQKQKQGQYQDQENKQGQFGYIDSHDVTTYEAQERNPVSSAAPVSASACSSGISAQGVDFGAAVARTNPYCNLALVSETAAARGNAKVADEMVDLMAEMARADSRGHLGIRGFLRGIPVIGGVLGWIW